MLADPRALCQRFVLPLFNTASTQRKGGFTTTKGGLGEMDEIQTAWLQTHDLGSYADLIPHILSVIVQVLQDKHTIAAFEIMEDDSQNARVAYLRSATSRKRPLYSYDHKNGGVKEKICDPHP